MPIGAGKYNISHIKFYFIRTSNALGECGHLNNLRFADDIVIIAKNRVGLCTMADLWRKSKKVVLSNNFSKTKIMTNISQFEEIRVGKNRIEVFSEYKYQYLGQTMSLENRTKNVLKIRRANAWKAFWVPSKILRGKMNLKSKVRIHKSTVYPTLTYGHKHGPIP